MSIVYCKKTRRQFLVGAGNTVLALPFLPSVFSSVASAQMAAPSTRRMMTFSFGHSVLKEYWPQRSLATTAIGSSGAKERLLSSLASSAEMSPLLSHSLYNTLRLNNKITIVRGLDVQKGGGHGIAATGGALETNAGNLVNNGNLYPTIDTMIDSSTSVYPLSTPASVTKAIRINFASDGGHYDFLRKVGGTYQAVPFYGYDNNQYYYNTKYYTLPVFYNDVFKSLTNGTVAPIDTTNNLKSNILNRVYQSYLSFKTNRKISSDDIARVDQHMGFLSDLQRSLNVTAPAPSTCAKPNSPIASNDPTVFTPLYMDLLAIAFKCGLTKYGSFTFEGHNPSWLPGLTLPSGTDLHGAIHGVNGGSLANLKKHSYETFSRYGLDLIASRFLAPLNELEGNTGRTYLDNMTTNIFTEMGVESALGGSGHSSEDMQQVLIGSMGGRMRAGNYLALPEITVNYFPYRLPYNALMVTLLDLMGVPASEYSAYSSNVGKGWGYYGSTASNSYEPTIISPLAGRFYQGISELIA